MRSDNPFWLFLMRLFKGWRIGRISQWITPDWGYCRRCDTSWGFVESHAVWTNPDEGACAMCERCWDEVSVEERVEHHHKFFLERADRGENWRAWEEAVRLDLQSENWWQVEVGGWRRLSRPRLEA